MLRQGHQYLRPISNFGAPFAIGGPGELIAWARILNDEEALCIVNANGHDACGADVIVDVGLNPPGTNVTVIANSQESASGSPAGVSHPIGSRLPVRRRVDGTTFVEIRGVRASEVVVLANHA